MAVMKAIRWVSYGGPESIELAEVPKPSPGEREMLVKVRATTVTAGDVELRRLSDVGVLTVPLRLLFGVFRPRGVKILGQELAGEVEAVGAQVEGFQVDDRVFGHTGLRFGGYAEYGILPGSGLVSVIPEGVDYEQAVTLPTAGVYALYFVRKAELEKGSHVLINGGGGAIGSFAIQLAKRAGATVTGVDRTDKLSLMKSLGADYVIDYTSERFSDWQTTFDVILDVIDKSSFGKAAPALKPGGLYLHTDTSPIKALRRRFSRFRHGRRWAFVPGGNDPADLLELAQLVRDEEIRVVIDGPYSLTEVPGAHLHAETGAKQGNIVVRVSR